VDDGSTDGTGEIVSRYCLKDQRIIYFSRDAVRRKGANACRNIGIEKSVGEYIAFLDSDDEWGIERLKKAVIFLIQSKAKAIYSGAIIKDDVSQRVRDPGH